MNLDRSARLKSGLNPVAVSLKYRNRFEPDKPMTIQPMISSALDITARASAIPRSYFRTRMDIDHKQDESPVTIADRETEKFIRDALQELYPEHAIFGEEFGREASDSDFEWIIDPIDGTRAFVTGMPLYGMLLALLKNGAPEFGIVRMPELEEVYSGDGERSLLNDNDLLQVSKVTRLDDAVIYLNEGEKIMPRHPRLFERLCSSGRLRRLGYDCYPHVLLADGRVDLVIDFDLKPYDYLALVPVIEGAGGLISDWRGKRLDLHSDGRIISAATPELQHEALQLIAACG